MSLEIENQNQIVALPAIQLADKKTLMTLLSSLFEKIDDLASDGKINSGEYKELADIVSDMSKIRQEVKTHIIYRTIDRQSRRNEPAKMPTEMEKMADDSKFANCEKCDKRLAKTSIKEHMRTKICNRTQQTKLNVFISKKQYCEVIFPKCQAYNTDLLPRYRPINKIRMSEKLLKALGVRKPKEIIQEGNTYKKITTRKTMGKFCLVTHTWELDISKIET
jgi:hypothetical protein